MTTTLPLIIGAAILFLIAGGLVVFGLVYMARGGADVSERMQEYMRSSDSSSSGQLSSISVLSGLRSRLNEWLSMLTSEDLEAELMSANWPITNIEYTLLRLIGILMAFLLGWLVFQNVLPGVGLAILAFVIPGLVMQWSIHRRQDKFNKQLVNVLVLLTGGIRAGYSFLQALDHVIRELPPPVSVEFGRVRQEIRLGISMRDALTNLSDRMDNKDLSLVVTAIIISQQVGGNMTQMMEVITDTIRARSRLFSEVQSLTSQQRFTGQMLSFLPIIVGGILFLINPTYMSRIFDPQLIWLPIGAGISILIGNIIVRSLVNIDY